MNDDDTDESGRANGAHRESARDAPNVAWQRATRKGKPVALPRGVPISSDSPEMQSLRDRHAMNFTEETVEFRVR
jgi:hypothetical protein